MFPRAAWLRSLREALAAIADADLGYGDPRGVEVLRAAPWPTTSGACAASSPDPASVVVTCGYSQGLGIVCHALARAGARRIAFEDPEPPRAAR